jgi:gamma-glutamylaminecyclotransferase
MTEYIFVYGSLKTGFGNHWLLSEKGLVGEGATASGIVLHCDGGFPFAVRGDGVAYGEVFQITSSILDDMDYLEGHPAWYKREMVEIALENGEIHDAWIYLNPQEAKSLPALSSGRWEGKRR